MAQEEAAGAGGGIAASSFPFLQLHLQQGKEEKEKEKKEKEEEEEEGKEEEGKEWWLLALC